MSFILRNDFIELEVSPEMGGKITMTKAGQDELSKLTIGRRLMQFGPEGFREVPKDHRLVIMMGANPEDFFKAMDMALKRRMGSDTFSEDLMAALDGLGSFLEL